MKTNRKSSRRIVHALTRIYKVTLIIVLALLRQPRHPRPGGYIGVRADYSGHNLGNHREPIYRHLRHTGTVRRHSNHRERGDCEV